MLYLFKHLLLIKTLKQGQGDGISEMLKQPFDYARLNEIHSFGQARCDIISMT